MARQDEQKFADPKVSRRALLRGSVAAGIVPVAGAAVAVAATPMLGGDAVLRGDVVLSGANRVKFLTTDAPWRIGRRTILDGADPPQRDHQFFMSYNLDYADLGADETPPKDIPSEPTFTMVLESRYNGSAEWNWDLSSPDGTGARPFGAYYSYDAKKVSFTFGDMTGGWHQQLGRGIGCGAQIHGGYPIEGNFGQLALKSNSGQEQNIFELRRQEETLSMKIHPTKGSIVMSPDSTYDVSSASYDGALKIVGAQTGVIVSGTSGQDTAFASQISDQLPRFVIQTDGKQRWGPGDHLAQDTALYRSAVNTLRTDGNFIAAGSMVSLSNVFQGSDGKSQLHFKTITLANGQSGILPDAGGAGAGTNGLFFIVGSNSTHSCFSLTGGMARAFKIFDPLNGYTDRLGTDKTTNINWNGVDSYQIENKTGADITYHILFFVA